MSYLDKAKTAGDYADAIGRCVGRSAAAALYADALRHYGPSGADWATINAAILKRWKPSSLNWIKERAWKIVRQEAP